MLGTSHSNTLLEKKPKLMVTLIFKKVNFSSTPLHPSLPSAVISSWMPEILDTLILECTLLFPTPMYLWPSLTFIVWTIGVSNKTETWVFHHCNKTLRKFYWEKGSLGCYFQGALLHHNSNFTGERSEQNLKLMLCVQNTVRLNSAVRTLIYELNFRHCVYAPWQFSGVSFFHPPLCGFWGLNSGTNLVKPNDVSSVLYVCVHMQTCVHVSLTPSFLLLQVCNSTVPHGRSAGWGGLLTSGYLRGKDWDMGC